MPKVEYVYTKPVKTKKSNKKLEVLIFLIIAISAYFLFVYKGNQNFTSNETFNQTNKTFTYGNKTFTITSIPSEYKGSKGLDYIRNNSALELAEAKSLCIDLLNGEWVDTSNALGCYNMKDFSIVFCERDIIKTLISLCNQINGNPDCSTNQVICSV
jgi:hypothetical protein